MAKKSKPTIFDEARAAGERARLVAQDAYLRPLITAALEGATHDAAMRKCGLDPADGAHHRAWYRAVKACGVKR